VSLLMDALRKAEQQKQQGKATADAPPATKGAERLALDPLPDPLQASGGSAGNQGEGLPELPRRMEELDEQFLSIPPAPGKISPGSRGPIPPRTPAGGKPGVDTARASAQNLFAAKQPDPPVDRNFAVGVGIATLLASLAIGGYFYWQLQPKGGLALNPASASHPPSSPSSQAAPRAPESATSTAFPSPTTVSSAPAVTAESSNNTGAKPQQARITTPAPKPDASMIASSPGAASTLPRTRQAAPEAPAAGAADSAIRLSKQPPMKIDDTQEAAHAAFSRGELERARTLWLKVLRTDDRNLNALLGLAVLAQQEGRADEAERFFKRALEVDPKDPVANAGLLALRPPSDPRLAESRLKGLLAEQPDSPHLHFALGNLYLGEARWAEAQQAFFKAHVADPGNADYLYNLAVSLDHLHQERLAAEYYARALAAAGAGPVAFDRAQAQMRLQALQAMAYR